MQGLLNRITTPVAYNAAIAQLHLLEGMTPADQKTNNAFLKRITPENQSVVQQYTHLVDGTSVHNRRDGIRAGLLCDRRQKLAMTAFTCTDDIPTCIHLDPGPESDLFKSELAVVTPTFVYGYISILALQMCQELYFEGIPNWLETQPQDGWLRVAQFPRQVAFQKAFHAFMASMQHLIFPVSADLQLKSHEVGDDVDIDIDDEPCIVIKRSDIPNE